MDARRLLILAAMGLSLCGCALWRDDPVRAAASMAMATAVPDGAGGAAPAPSVQPGPTMAVVGLSRVRAGSERPYEAGLACPAADPTAEAPEAADASAVVTGRRAIAAANAAARAPSRQDGFVGGVQVFVWSPGRVYEVWTAPLRVTTLTLAPGETLVTKAAGDTVRWQIGEAMSGAGASRRTHVLLKPLERGLETNLVLTTNRRVYLIDLKSGAADAFNAAVAWDAEALLAGQAPGDAVESATVALAEPVAMPQGELDARYRIDPRGRRPHWTPTSVFNDGLRTFITFDPDLQVDEAPVLFVIAPDGEAQMVNYRQVGGLYVVDRVFDRAELRLGDRRPQVVRIQRLTGAR